MIREDFDKIVERRATLTRQTLIDKGNIYSKESDCFHNFKKAARRRGITPAQALLGMLEKHLVNVDDKIESGRAPSQEWIDEKIGDVINYFILLEGIWTEEMNT